MKFESRVDMKSEHGYSLVEMLTVFFIIATLSAIAIPSYMQWRESLEYREAAREVASILRLAQSGATGNTNRQHRVRFVQATRQYCIERGNRNSNSV